VSALGVGVSALGVELSSKFSNLFDFMFELNVKMTTIPAKNITIRNNKNK